MLGNKMYVLESCTMITENKSAQAQHQPQLTSEMFTLCLPKSGTQTPFHVLLDGLSISSSHLMNTFKDL